MTTQTNNQFKHLLVELSNHFELEHKENPFPIKKAAFINSLIESFKGILDIHEFLDTYSNKVIKQYKKESGEVVQSEFQIEWDYHDKIPMYYFHTLEDNVDLYLLSNNNLHKISKGDKLFNFKGTLVLDQIKQNSPETGC